GRRHQYRHPLHDRRRRRDARRIRVVLHLSDSPGEPPGCRSRADRYGRTRAFGRDRSMLNLLGLPVAASAHAGEIDEMIVLVHWLMAILFVGWGLFFIYVLFRFRKGANPKASYTGAKGKISKGLEVAVAIVEVVLLVFYAIPAWAKRVKAFPSENEALVV